MGYIGPGQKKLDKQRGRPMYLHILRVALFSATVESGSWICIRCTLGMIQLCE